MNQVGVKFLLGGSQFFVVLMGADEARELILNFRRRNLPEFIGDEPGQWSLRASSVHAIHLQPVEEPGAGGMPVQRRAGEGFTGVLPGTLPVWPPRVSGI